MSDSNLDSFLRRLATVNPFLDNRVTGPAPDAVDVEAIHQGVFERLSGLARQVHLTRQAIGAVLWGEAGIGKSHLLARLRRWSKAGNARYLYVNDLQAAPDALPRSLLHAVVSHLTRGRRDRFAGTRLHELMRVAVTEAAGGPSKIGWAQLRDTWHRWLDKQTRPGDRLVYEVLFSFFQSASKANIGRGDEQVAGLAVRWLSGEALDPAEAKALGLPPGRQRDDPVALDDAHGVKQVLIALARLTQCQDRPLILALDQVDNLDRDQAAALTRFLESLIDSATNLLVITSGIQATLTRWCEERVVQQSAWDRLAQFKFLMPKLTPAQAEELIRARLTQFLAPYAKVEELTEPRTRDRLFPLGQAWFGGHLLFRTEVRPRDVISLARDAWQAQQERLARVGLVKWLLRWPGEDSDRIPRPIWTNDQRLAAIDRVISEELDANRKRLLSGDAPLPGDSDRLAAVLLDLLQQAEPPAGVIEVARVPPGKRNTPPAYHLSLWRRQAETEHVTGILLLATSASSAVAASLRRLGEEARPLDRVVVVTDERTGLPLGDRGREPFDDLRSRGEDRFHQIELKHAELADLESLGRVLSRARAGDLDIEPPGGSREKLTTADVLGSPAWRKRFAGNRLLADLLRTLPLASPA